MADFNVNASKQIPLNAKQSHAGDSGSVDVSWTPVTPILQGVGIVNLVTEQIFGGDQSSVPSSATQNPPQQPSSLPVDTAINEDSYDEFSLAFKEQNFFSGLLPSWFSDFTSGGSTPEQRGQFAAQNIAANIFGGGLPSVPYPEPQFNFDMSQPVTTLNLYINFAKE